MDCYIRTFWNIRSLWESKSTHMHQHCFLPCYGQMKIFLQNSFVSAVEKTLFYRVIVDEAKGFRINIHSNAVSFSIKSNFSSLTFILLWCKYSFHCSILFITDISSLIKKNRFWNWTKHYRSTLLSNLSTPAAIF